MMTQLYSRGSQWLLDSLRWVRAALCAALLTALPAHAQLSIEITGAGANRLPIAVADFAGEEVHGDSIAAIVRKDLERSGLFRLIDAAGTRLEDTPDAAAWRRRGADTVTGCTIRRGSTQTETRCTLFDAQKSAVLGNVAFQHGNNRNRAAAHRIADFIYEKLTGEPGVFSTRIAYVSKAGNNYQLQVADADGANPETALTSREPIISPAWSPDGNKLAYVSFEAKKPIIYIHDLYATGQRRVLANFKGSNSAPTWAPDGKRLAVVLTKDGGSQIYLIRADGSGATRLTNSASIDTEPTFTPDGNSVLFTSDRGGSPQIYRVSAGGGTPERLTFDGAYNVTPRVAPDGKSVAFISRNSGRYQLSLMDLTTRQTQVLTDSAKDESPSFAPNGRIIIYATEIGGRGVLSTVSTDGRVKQKLSAQSADIREPAWGPFLR